MKKIFKLIALVMILLLILSSCMTVLPVLDSEPPTYGPPTPTSSHLDALPVPKKKIIAAVYNFADKTGQFMSTAAGSSNSRAVTQGATSMLVQALLDSGWFVVVEREGINNLINERKIIELATTSFSMGDDKQTVTQPPLLYADIILEGGIIAYETNLLTGGLGVRYLGIGGNTQFRKDQVTIYLRAVSTRTGQVLKNVYTTKSVLSILVDGNIYKYVKVKEILEVETGFSINEPPQLCVREAIEKGVESLVIEGVLSGLWLLEKEEDLKLLDGYIKEKEAFIAAALSADEKIPQNQFNLGINAGVQLYTGDYRETSIRGAVETSIQTGLFSNFSLRLNGSVGQVAADDYFQTTWAETALAVRYKLFDDKKITPFLSLGGGVVNFKIQDAGGNYVNRADPLWGWKPTAVLNLGLEYFANKNWSVNCNFNFHYNFTDQIDGIIHGNLPDYTWGFATGFAFYP